MTDQNLLERLKIYARNYERIEEVEDNAHEKLSELYVPKIDKETNEIVLNKHKDFLYKSVTAKNEYNLWIRMKKEFVRQALHKETDEYIIFLLDYWAFMFNNSDRDTVYKNPMKKVYQQIEWWIEQAEHDQSNCCNC
jgi:hypothetical protein